MLIVRLRLNNYSFLHEQTALRADCYQDLCDAILDPRNVHVGCRVILPSTFTGGPRYMHEHQQDAMTYVYVRKYGHVHYHHSKSQLARH